MIIFISIQILYNTNRIHSWSKSSLLVHNEKKDVSCVVYCFHVNNKDEWALVYGNPKLDKMPLVRIQSQCITGLQLDDTECDCKQNLEFSKKMLIDNPNGGILFLLNQDGKSHGGVTKLKELSMRNSGVPGPEILNKLNIPWDIRNYSFLPQALNIIGVQNNIRLITRFNERPSHLKRDGVNVAEIVPYEYYVNKNNYKYLKMKKTHYNYNFEELG